jgi:hypothetical protein
MFAVIILECKENKREELLYIDRPFDVDEYRNRKTNEALKN